MPQKRQTNPNKHTDTRTQSRWPVNHFAMPHKPIRSTAREWDKEREGERARAPHEFSGNFKKAPTLLNGLRTLSFALPLSWSLMLSALKCHRRSPRPLATTTTIILTLHWSCLIPTQISAHWADARVAPHYGKWVMSLYKCVSVCTALSIDLYELYGAIWVLYNEYKAQKEEEVK